MLTRIAVAVSICGMVYPAVAFGQGFAPDDKDFFLNGIGVSSDDWDNKTLTIGASLGYFFTDNIEGSIRQDISYVEGENTRSAAAAATRGALDYYFDMGRWWPFVGVTLGYVYGDEVNESWAFGPEGGVKYFVNDTTYIFGTLGIEWFSDSGGKNDVFDDGRWIYAVGIGYRW